MATALTAVNRESELSYAYLHAIASHAGVNCKTSNRHDDNAGIDAMLTGWEQAGVTVKIPKHQVFDGTGLMKLMASISRREIPAYKAPAHRVPHGD
ncbi:MAG TPA: hypothetical protein VGP09_03725 [Caballeronia sp.]|jgi:hypothetical protein|nr:hypothetical protein [Caballeronia sp.]HEV7832484.1 hypothetical protein [Caballeronia sp.]